LSLAVGRERSAHPDAGKGVGHAIGAGASHEARRFDFVCFSRLAAAALAVAAFAPSAVAQENTTVWACQSVGSRSLEPLGDREGHSISVGQYSCRAESGPFAGGVATGMSIYEWDDPKATLISDSGVVRKPGATFVWKTTDGKLALTMTDGKMTGWTGSGRSTIALATGAWASMAGKSFTSTAKSVGLTAQYSIETKFE
jgi:hypothetical protein